MPRPLLAVLFLTACSREHEAEQLADAASAPSPDPALVVEQPAAADWLPIGPTPLTGYVQDASNVAVDTTDSALDLDASLSFASELTLQRGINRIEVTADGDDGLPLTARLGVIAGEFADPGGAPDVMAARLNQGGIDTLSRFAETLITADLLEESLSAANPVYSAAPIIGTWLDADLVGVTFREPSIVVVPASGALALQADIPELVTDVDVYGEIAWFDFAATVQVTADPATITADLVLTGEGGTLTADIEDATVTLTDFGYDASVLPSWIEDYFFTDSIRTAIEDALIAQLEELVPALLAETLSGLALDYEAELLGRPLTLAASFDSVAIDDAGVDIGVGVAVSVPSEGEKHYAGFLTTSAAPPTPDLTSPMALSLPDDLLNRALFELWRGGVGDVRLSTDDGSLDAELFTDFPVETATITTRADLPPVIVESGGLLELQLAELELAVDTPGASVGDHLTAKVDLTAQLSMAIEGSALSLQVGEVDIGMSILDSDWGVTPDGLELLVRSFLTPSAIQEALDGLALELPTLYGLSVTSAQVARADSGAHTDVSLTVEVAE